MVSGGGGSGLLGIQAFMKGCIRAFPGIYLYEALKCFQMPFLLKLTG